MASACEIINICDFNTEAETMKCSDKKLSEKHNSLQFRFRLQSFDRDIIWHSHADTHTHNTSINTSIENSIEMYNLMCIVRWKSYLECEMDPIWNDYYRMHIEQEKKA